VEYNKGAFLDLQSMSKTGKGEVELHYLVEEEDFELEGNTAESMNEGEEIFMSLAK
jgi:hypothetical protein